jgi:hypothetical protein
MITIDVGRLITIDTRHTIWMQQNGCCMKLDLPRCHHNSKLNLNSSNDDRGTGGSDEDR